MVKGLLTKLVLLTTESLGTLTLGAVGRSIVKPRTVKLIALTLIALTLIALTLGGGGGFSSVWGQAETANAASQETVKATEKATETWNNARLWGQPEAPPPFQPKRVYQGVLLKQPVGMARTPSSNRLFVYERRGRLYSFVDSPAARAGAKIEPDLCLDIRDIGEETREIYGVAFAPDFETSRDVYICYISKPDDENGTQVSRFKMSREDPPVIDLASEESILSFRSGGHNGGCLRFGPDQFLYISTGDAGPASPPDPLQTGQDNRDLLASILRIDVSRPSQDLPYTIPADNPLIGTKNCRPEIFAYGLRNPWKMSFDPRNGDLWVGDVGWELWEMIYRVVPGGNYGWRIREGHQLIHPEDEPGPTPILPPAAVHSHRESRSITGGYVYLGKRHPELQGGYIYADYETGKVWSLELEQQKINRRREIADTDLKIVAFGQTLDNELLLVDFQEGGLYELEAREDRSFNPDFPTRLSETGLFTDLSQLTAAPGLHEYQLTAEPWMDGLQARRWIGIPSQETARPVGQGFRFPEGTVLVKTLTLPGPKSTSLDPTDIPYRLETQILLFHQGVWHPYSFAWNRDQTDATLVPAEGTEIELEVPLTTALLRSNALSSEADHRSWVIASRAECLGCHTTFKPEMGVLGFEPLQLAPKDAVTFHENQWSRLARAGVLPEQPTSDQQLVNPYSETAPLEARARSYLHVNCRHCHRDGGGGGSTMKLEYHRPIEQLDLVDWKAQHGGFGLAEGQRIRAGSPETSVLVLRMAKVGRGRMPYKGSEVVDAAGLALMTDWIQTLERNPPLPTPSETSPASRERFNQLPTEYDDPIGLLATESETLSLVLALHRVSKGNQLRKQWSALSEQTDNPTVRDLLNGLLPFKTMNDTLGKNFDEAMVLGSEGDAARGRELFFSREFQCAQCHRVGGEGGIIGPDLSGIASQQTRVQLLTSLRRPSETIAEGFRTSLISTVDGGLISGRILQRTDEKVQVAMSDGRMIELELSNIEEIQPSQLSLMPDDLVSQMTAQKLADVLTYLETLKTQ